MIKDLILLGSGMVLGVVLTFVSMALLVIAIDVAQKKEEEFCGPRQNLP